MTKSSGEEVVGFLIIILIVAAIFGAFEDSSSQDHIQPNYSAIYPTSTPNPETWRLYADSQYLQDVSNQLQNSQLLVRALKSDIANLQGTVSDQNLQLQDALQTVIQQLEQAKIQAEQDRINQQIQLRKQQTEGLVITFFGAILSTFMGWMISDIYSPKTTIKKLGRLVDRLIEFMERVKNRFLHKD